MTLRDYLKLMRRPEYHGINARAMLQHYGRTGAKRSWRFTAFHLSVGFESGVKHDLFRMTRA